MGARIAKDYGLQTKGFKVVIPKELQEEFITEYHCAPAHGHPGIDKTIERITRNYHISGIRRKVEKVIQNCQECQKNKVKRHRPYGLLQPLNPAEGAWESVSIDFIVKLPTLKEPGTGQVCDSILVIVDRLTKYAYFIPTKESIQAQDMAYLVLRTLLANHQVPREIVSDRGTLFTSTFWQTLLVKLGAKSKLSTSFYPQTDGQTERTNQTLEQYLRIFSNHPQDNWVELLPMAQFAYNSSKSSTTGRTPFYANYGYEPTAYRETAPTANGSHGINEKATRKVEELRSLHDKLRERIAQGNEKMAQQANKKRIEGPILKRGDRVYLLTKNLPTLRLSKKLDAIRIGPFEVKKRIKEVNYELRLPKNMRIRPVFYVSLLEPAPADTPLETDIEMEPDQTDYEVEQILDVRKFGNQWRYLVKWKNYPSEENSWEPIKCLKDCPKRLEQFHQQNPQKFDPRRQNSTSRVPRRNQGTARKMDQRRPRHQKGHRIARIQPPALCPNSDHLHAPTLQDAPYRRGWQQYVALEGRLHVSQDSAHEQKPPANRKQREQLSFGTLKKPSRQQPFQSGVETIPYADERLRKISARGQRLGPTHQQSTNTQEHRNERNHVEHIRHNDSKRTEEPCRRGPACDKPNIWAFRHQNDQSAERARGGEESWQTWHLAKPATQKGAGRPTFIPHGPRSRNAKLRGRSWRRGRRVLRAASQDALHEQGYAQDTG